MNRLTIILGFFLGASPGLNADPFKRGQEAVEQHIYETVSGFETIDAAADLKLYGDAAAYEETFTGSGGQAHAVLAVFGGYASCRPGPIGQRIFAAASQLRRRLRQEAGVATRIFATCYGKMDRRAMAFRSSAPDRITPIPNLEVAPALAAEIAKTTTKSVYIVGHSYGGWLALKVAQALPAKYHIRLLATLDPISQVECKPHQFGTRAFLDIMSEPVHPGCTRAPNDFVLGDFTAIARRSTRFLDFFQTDTSHLHSGPLMAADYIEEVAYKDSKEPDRGHSNMVDDGRVWRTIEQAALAFPAKPPEKTIVGFQPPLAHQLAQGIEASYTLASEMSLKVFNRYQKGSFAIYPPADTRRRAERQGSPTPKTSVYQPNVEPSLGLSLHLGQNFELAFTRSLDFLKLRENTKGSSRVHHYELHFLKPHYGVDLYYQNYRGLFLDRVAVGDVTPFRDALFRGNHGIVRYPRMTLRSYGANFFYVFDPPSFSLPGAMSTRVLVRESGWSPLLMVALRDTELKNPEAIIPAAEQVYYGGSAQIRGASLQTATFLPGVGGSLVFGRISAHALFSYGIGYQTLRLSHAGPGQRDGLAYMGDFRGSLLYNSGSYFGGISGYKANIASVVGALGVSESVSTFDGFFGHHF